MNFTMNVQTAKFKQLQELVKIYNLRFSGRLYMEQETTLVDISGDHLPDNLWYIPFVNDWEQITTPIVEKKSPHWKQILRRMGIPI